MGWNGSGNKTVQKNNLCKKQRKLEDLPLSLARVVYYSVVIMIAGCLCYFAYSWFKSNNQEQNESSDPASNKIEVVSPELNEPSEEVVHLKPTEETYRDERGVLRYKIGNGRAPDPDRKVSKNSPSRDANGAKRFGSRYTIFETRAENEIAKLISVTPGTQLFGSRRYDDRFEQEFLESCQTPIIVEPGDSNYVKNLKRAMNEVKIEIRNRMASGEKLSDILSEARKELQRLAEYKRNIKRETVELLQSGTLSDDDASDLIEAANVMLNQKGMSPIPASSLMRSHLKLSDMKDE